ncbi:hypothetical protein M2171_000165 [Bradyrhizobium japonicum USDA 38]|nr:hypothetical protein [Bradyrhizobium japonicum USDA 38]MCS3943548.1 hypothetical protein [Bradyrhizobium japonicum]MCW2223755.1 hypothetical protein [Bradyrhizobium japonicum]MCW2348367.1 hypothetical protein [Bradyrhizobium japonicum]
MPVKLSTVVSANAGTHNHREQLSREALNPESSPNHFL